MPTARPASKTAPSLLRNSVNTSQNLPNGHNPALPARPLAHCKIPPAPPNGHNRVLQNRQLSLLAR